MFSKRILLTKLRFWIRPPMVREFFDGLNVFFVLALGRSGTTFLANLLNAADESKVFHEAIPEDYQACAEAFTDKRASLNYIQAFRRRYMYLVLRGSEVKTYGEVNGLLRNHVEALEQSFPGVRMLHLIRDGRDVVRSMMARSVYTEEDWHAPTPPKQDPLRGEWHKLSRFEKICWYWADTNRRLSDKLSEYARFEDVLQNYEYFRNRVAGRLGLTIDYQTWCRAVRKPKNPTSNHVLPEWPLWSSEQKDSFRVLCGEVMRDFDYW